MDGEKETLEILREKNRRFRSLEKKHLEMDDALRLLNRRRILTPQEELQKKILQKRKLAAKDNMVEMIRNYKMTESV